MLEKDFEYYISNRFDLNKKFGQSFVIIQNQIILKSLPSFQEAIKYLESKTGAYLVQEVNNQPDAQTSLLLQ